MSTPIQSSDSPHSTQINRLRDAAQSAIANDPGKAHLVNIGGKNYYIVNVTGGELGDLGPLAGQVEKARNLFKAVIHAHTSDFAYLDAQGAHKEDGSLVEHHASPLNDQGNTAFEQGTAGSKSAEQSLFTEHQRNTLDLYKKLLKEPEEINYSSLKDFANEHDLPNTIQQAINTGAEASDTTQVLTKRFQEAIKLYINELIKETTDSIHSDDPQQAYLEAEPNEEITQSLTSQLDEANETLASFAKQFAIHNATARQVRTAQHAWDALAKIIDSTIHQGDPVFPNLQGFTLIPATPNSPKPNPVGLIASGLTVIPADEDDAASSSSDESSVSTTPRSGYFTPTGTFTEDSGAIDGEALRAQLEALSAATEEATARVTAQKPTLSEDPSASFFSLTAQDLATDDETRSYSSESSTLSSSSSFHSISLEDDQGARYEQLERLALGENIPEWDTSKGTKEDNRRIATHLFQQMNSDNLEADLSPIHLSLLKETIRNQETSSGFQDLIPFNRFASIQRYLKINYID